MAVDIIWSPPEWACCCFPLPEPNAEVLSMDYIVGALQVHLNKVTEADTTALGRALHVGHILTTMQSRDGDWPAILNVRTGEWVGAERSLAPVPLFERMTAMLNTTEFDHVIQRAVSSKS
jgi:hypothetical protein